MVNTVRQLVHAMEIMRVFPSIRYKPVRGTE